MSLPKLKSKFLALAIFALFFMSAVPTTFAEDTPNGANAKTAEAEEENGEDLPPMTFIPTKSQNETLAEKFQTGKFELYDLPNYVVYLIEFLIYIAGGIAVLFVVIGGYKYMLGGTTNDKETGKKAIGYALTGFAIVVLAWTIVNFTQVWLTGGNE